jgi:calmodulin
MTVEKSKLTVSEDLKALMAKEKLTSLMEAFAKLDSNRNGKIGKSEFLDFSLAKETKHLTKRFEALDADSDGFIDFEEFVAATEPNYAILKRFRELDLDRNGLLSLEEAIHIADQLVLPLNSTEIGAIMKEADHDGDGQITYYQYLGAVARIGFQ